MANYVDAKTLFTRRAILLGGLKTGLSLTLLGRIYYLQVWKSDHYYTLAKENSIKLDPLIPQRGLIFDQTGQQLATNLKNYRLMLLAGRSLESSQTLKKLASLIDLDSFSIERMQRDIAYLPRFIPFMVRENLTWDELSLIEVNSPDLPGIFIEEGQKRSYPFKEEIAHILGYVQAASETEIKDNPLLRLSGFKIGKTGIEKALDDILQGIPGYREIEVDARRHFIRQISQNASQNGTNVTLTINISLQQAVNQRLASQPSTSAVIMNVHNGAILALCSTPSFDPNSFTTSLNQQQWQELTSNPYKPLINKAISGEYAPGSAFKMVIALAALELGLITPQDRVFCRGYLYLHNHPFHCYKKGGHGNLNFSEAIAISCDIFFYILAQRIGIERIAAFARQLGLGSLTGIELPGERSGLIPDKTWKKERYGKAWTPAETILTGIGQGYLLTTPLQLALMTARLVNGGKAVIPRLIHAIGNQCLPIDPFPSLGFQPKTLRLLLDAMNQAVNSPIGTSRGAQITIPGWEMGGKTSTTQVRRITLSEREKGLKTLKRSWLERDHAMFIGFAPLHHPHFAVSVVVEHGGWGSAVAAPIARDLILETLKRIKL